MKFYHYEFLENEFTSYHSLFFIGHYSRRLVKNYVLPSRCVQSVGVDIFRGSYCGKFIVTILIYFNFYQNAIINNFMDLCNKKFLYLSETFGLPKCAATKYFNSMHSPYSFVPCDLRNAFWYNSSISYLFILSSVLAKILK